MTSLELNMKLQASFPEIISVYREETSWQDGDETGSHVVYADVFVPFIKDQISQGNELCLTRIFDYIESLLVSEDLYANEVLSLSVLESLVCDEEIDSRLLLRFAKERTIQVVQEILQNMAR